MESLDRLKLALADRYTVERKTAGQSSDVESTMSAFRGRPDCVDKDGPSMSSVKLIVVMTVSVVAFAPFSSRCVAQQVTGEAGSPGATTTISGKQLPPPDPKFGGVINERASESKAWWAPRVVPPEGAPNVLLIMTDDVGFGAPGTFGGVVPTPALDRIAKSGLRYTNFHSAALCSPTRACLLYTSPSPRDTERSRMPSSA